MLVVAEAGPRQLAGDHPAAEPLVALEHEHLLPRHREIGRGDEAVVTRSDDDDVRIGHEISSSCVSVSEARSYLAGQNSLPSACWLQSALRHREPLPKA